MRFRNTASHPLDFKIEGHQYACDVDGEVDITARHSLAVKRHGLPLEPIDGDPVAQFREREAKRALEKVDGRHTAFVAELQDQMEAAAAAHVEAIALLESELAGVRARLDLKPEESILGALDMLLGEPVAPAPPDAKPPKKP